MSKCECKECLHYDVCLYKPCVGECPLYKSKSLWRVMPYNVGDEVYLVSQKGGFNVMWYMFEAIVIGFHIDERNALEIRVKCTNTSVDMTGYYREDLVFLSREEAEKKLKEMGV